MFQKILYPTDFSDVAEKALTYSKKLKDSGAKEVVVLHVIDDRGFDRLQRIMGDNKFEALKKSREEETQKQLEGIAKELTEAVLKVTPRVEAGMPIREILRVEKEEDVSALVIGSHGMSNLQELFLGSVSEKVIRRSKTPVFVIKR
ncbi:MAG: universal stress protein, partial [Deltaproteobacteria bacterium]|jgi:nucleotide-binding universal stress UspA family protein|nr:universal stress protein [Deltaproteobacteria bacterium]